MEWYYFLPIVLVGIIFVVSVIPWILRSRGLEEYGHKIPVLGSLYAKFKPKPRPFKISFGDKIGFVFSGKGDIYRIHLGIVIETSDKSVLDNVGAELDKKHKFIFGKFYRFDEFLGGRIPEYPKDLPLEMESPLDKEGLELHTLHCKPFNLRFKEHQLVVNLTFSDKKISKKLDFRFDRYYKKGFDGDRKNAIESGQPKVSFLPIEKTS